MPTRNAADDAMLEVMTVAAVTGHSLDAWQPFTGAAGDGWQATCSRCRQTVAVWRTGVIHSLLDDWCSGEA